MAPLLASRGFTADVHPCRTTVRTKRKCFQTLVLSALGISFVLVLALLPSLSKTDTVDTSNSSSTSVELRYDFKIYALNCTSQKHAPGGTLFKFVTTDLPFNITALSFGDYRADTTFSHKYYSGSGILVNATGGNSTMVLKENNGLIVSSISYHGQAQVVFNGEVKTVTYPTNLTTYEGTEQIVQDWKNATWAPTQGIIIEHPNSVSLSGAKFYIMTFEPTTGTEIPEFGPWPMVLTAMILIVVSRRIIANRY